ncbi:leucine-rich repeat domain-containing protein [Adlercreutzia sp. ZJ473]|uniref:leucine-rich repeat domain-containing protein n=1 Tax=Adlercreutzia sp. ZJ473 TaxID=2722822 RepID=UPI001557A843|nr:leucine-rich repeat domain-containing protein [Adlercreutzia sp. ZJ473]
MLDEEILAEGRLSEDREVLLYNISLRQDNMRTQSTDMPLSALEGSEAYQEMIARGLLACEVLHHGSFPVANVRATLKGLRYCVLYSEVIEPNRQFDIAGNVRANEQAALEPDESAAEPYAGPHVVEEGDRSRLVFPSMIPTGFSDSGAAIALSDTQLKEIAEIGDKRVSFSRRERGSVRGSRSGERMFEAPDGAVWRYVVIDGSFAQITGIKAATRALSVPAEIEGAPVLAIASSALSGNSLIEEIVCADGIDTIGSGAFRRNANLRRLVLPKSASDFDASWIDQCPHLEELVLPGGLERIRRGVLSSGKLKKLVIGRAVRAVDAGALQGSDLAEVVVSAENPFITTDGSALYSADLKQMIALACPREELSVAQGCEVIGEKCCHGFKSLERVSLPDSVTTIGPFAFSDTGMRRFVAPSSLKSIEDKAFFYCAQLHEAVLNEGLESIGGSAFRGSSLDSLTIPATVKHIGASVTRGTNIVHSGPRCTFFVDERSKDQFYDGEGGLYRREADGIHLVQLIDAEKEIYSVYDGAVAIEPMAFAFHDRITRVRIPDTVRSIGESAFRVCKNLRHVSLPDSVQTIGDEAFFDTNLEEVRIPASLESLGDRALVTEGAHYGRGVPSLARVDVSPANDAFYLACGMLCRRSERGDSVIIYVGSEPEVVFPDEIVRVEDYAFNNARGIELLSLNPSLKVIGSSGLSTRCWIERIHVELAEPLEGRRVFDFCFPNTQSGIRGISVGLGGANWVNVPGIVEQLDICLANAHSFAITRDKKDDISAYEQVRLILDRFEDPFMLTGANRTSLERIVRNNIVEISVDVALHDDRATFDELVDRGYVNPGNIDEIIERVTALRDAATSAHLLETKRLMCSESVFDYDL